MQEEHPGGHGKTRGTSSLNTSVSIRAYVCKIGILGSSFHTFIFLFVSLLVYVSTYPFIYTFSCPNCKQTREEIYKEKCTRRCSVYTYLPYSPAGGQVKLVASWTPVKGLLRLTDLPFFYDKFSK